MLQSLALSTLIGSQDSFLCPLGLSPSRIASCIIVSLSELIFGRCLFDKSSLIVQCSRLQHGGTQHLKHVLTVLGCWERPRLAAGFPVVTRVTDSVRTVPESQAIGLQCTIVLPILADLALLGSLGINDFMA